MNKNYIMELYNDLFLTLHQYISDCNNLRLSGILQNYTKIRQTKLFKLRKYVNIDDYIHIETNVNIHNIVLNCEKSPLYEILLKLISKNRNMNDFFLNSIVDKILRITKIINLKNNKLFVFDIKPKKILYHTCTTLNDFREDMEYLPNSIREIIFYGGFCANTTLLLPKNLKKLVTGGIALTGTKIPKTLKFLNVMSLSGEIANNLPLGLQYLKIHNLPIDCEYLHIKYLEPKLKFLSIDSYMQPVNIKNLPYGIKRLYINCDICGQLKELPKTVKNLSLGPQFNDNIDNLPNGLKILDISFYGQFNQKINKLPDGLIQLMLPNDYYYNIQVLPESLKLIKCNKQLKENLEDKTRGRKITISVY